MYFFNRTTYYRHCMPYIWLLVAGCFIQPSVCSFHLVLDPAGDAKNTGRQLATCAERGVTLQLCEMLKESIIKEIPHCTVTITRAAGETRTQEQRAQIANQLQADLFVHISCFSDTVLRPRLAFYYHAPSPIISPSLSLYTLIPAHKAHDLVSTETRHMVHSVYTTLKGMIPYTLHAPAAIPDARLAGLTIPACTLECGITGDVPWTTLVEPLSNALIECLGN